MFEWLAVYVTFLVVCIKLYIFKTVNMFYTPKQGTVTRISKKQYIVEFYLGETRCNIVVSRTTGPLPFYMATSNETDITTDIVPFFTARPVPPTPSMVGHDEIILWDMEDNGEVFASHDEFIN